MLAKLLLCAASMFALAACSVFNARVAPQPLIPLAQLFGNPAQYNGQISPDGKWVSWTAPLNGVANLWLAPADNPLHGTPLTHEQQRPTTGAFWAPDSSAILFMRDTDGDENLVLYKVPVSGAQAGIAQALTPTHNTRMELVGQSTRVTDRILIGLNDRDPKTFDVYSLDIASGKLTEVLRNTEGYGHFIVDGNLQLRAVSLAREDGTVDLFRLHGDRLEKEPFSSIDLANAATTEPLGLTPDGKSLYWLDSRNRDTAALVAQDFATGATRVLAEDPHADISETMVNYSTGEIQGYASEYMKIKWKALTPAFDKDLAFLTGKLAGQLYFTSQTLDDSRWIIYAESSTSPGTTYLYDRPTQRLTKLFSIEPALEDAPLAAMHPKLIVSRDGLSQVSYLTLPAGSDQKISGTPDRPLPMVLLVHGGPASRDSYGFHSEHQWLANRGYAVLSVNFRGSTGFGKRFIAAGDQQWGATMQDDLLDAVDWAVRNGIAQPDRVAIMGGSYGGYATLAGLTQTPQRFACGVDIFGPSNLQTLLASMPAYWEGEKLMIYQRIGDPTSEAGRQLLHDRSPLFKAAAIRKPLLIVQGANDPRVKQAESDQIVAAMASHNIPVTYAVFPDEGHGFQRPENNIALSALSEIFLQNCLGGRAAPLGDALKASSITVPHGQAYIPGLEAALKAH